MTTLTPSKTQKDIHNESDEEQLLRLFWNRAELKKQLAAQEKHVRQLEDQARQQDAVVLRIQQRLDQLESQLSNPKLAPSVLTYYQLRGLWRRCHEQLLALSKELRKVYVDRAHHQTLVAFRAEQDKKIAELDAEIHGLEAKLDSLSEEISLLQQERESKSGLFSGRKKRVITDEISSRRQESSLLQGMLAKLNKELQEAQDNKAAEVDDLDTTTKRKINLAVISYAQELVLFFEDMRLAELARESAVNQLADVKFGDHRDCRELQSCLAAKRKQLLADDKILERVQRRTNYLHTQADYRNDNDTVPMAGSVASIIVYNINGEICDSRGINVLADEYWDLFSVLCV